jgi:hypothetical protein
VGLGLHKIKENDFLNDDGNALLYGLFVKKFTITRAYCNVYEIPR